MPVPPKTLEWLYNEMSPLLGAQFTLLKIPGVALKGFEPSQIGTIVGTLMDACIPQLDEIIEGNRFRKLGLSKNPGILKDREGYPDYMHQSGLRLELKLHYVDPTDVVMKKPATAREPSARLTQKVTVKNVEPDKDVLLVLAYELRKTVDDPSKYSPTIIDIGLFSVDECVAARDHRLLERGGRWFGIYETPAVMSKVGKAKLRKGEPLDTTTYGRKESEGRDFNEDTNFGKLARIPHSGLNAFLRKHGWRASGDEDAETGPLEFSE